MNELRVIAITHKQFPLDTIGKFHVPADLRAEVLLRIKETFHIKELMYLSTCNRVELIFSLPHYVCPGVTANIIKELIPTLPESDLKEYSAKAERYNGVEAAQHLINVASSIDSVVIGEREIITQLRKAYEECQNFQLTGDDIRMVISQCIKTAKEVFTHTDLSKKPVSVVSLAWQQLRNFGLKTDERILLIGAGQIIRNFSKFLFENGYHNITVANRTIENAETIVGQFGGKALSLQELSHFTEGFDAIVSCTGSNHTIIDKKLYASLLIGETSQKLVIDLALPADVDQEILEEYSVKYVGMNQIQEEASRNIQFRELALQECLPIVENGMRELDKIWQSRQIEKAMQSIPETIKEIRNTALGSVFAKDLENLDDNSRELLEKIMSYMEKKYISIPMKMAREVLLNQVSNN